MGAPKLCPEVERRELRLPLVPVDYHVSSRSAAGDDIGLSVLVEIHNFQILAGNLVVNKVCDPHALLLARGI